MKKMVALVSMAVVVAVLVAGLAGTFGTAGTPSVYASRLAGIAGAGITGIQIQNLDASQTATIVADFYKQSGGGAISIPRPNVQAGAAANIYLPNESTLQNGAYAAIISADRQIAAIARTDWNNSGAAAIYSNVQPGTDVSLPLAVKGYANQTSLVSIQNTDTGTQATVTVEFYEVGKTAPTVTTSVNIGPGTSTTIDLSKHAAFATVPQGALGSMKFKSTTNIGVQSFIDIETSAKGVYAFEGVPSEQAAAKLFVPLYRNDYYGTTGISVVNPGTSPVQVTVTYYGSTQAQVAACKGATFVHAGGPQTIAAGSSGVFYQADVNPPLPTGNAGLPKGCFGSAVIEATGGNVLAIVNDADIPKGTSAAYNAVSTAGGANKVALPLYRNKHTTDQLSTGIQAMNIGSSPANVTLEIKDSTGSVISGACGGDCTATIPPNSSNTWYPPTMTSQNQYAGNYGSATLNSTQPLAVIVNDASGTLTKDSAIYNGIKADN
jgi:hypothetical protein